MIKLVKYQSLSAYMFEPFLILVIIVLIVYLVLFIRIKNAETGQVFQNKVWYMNPAIYISSGCIIVVIFLVFLGAKDLALKNSPEYILTQNRMKTSQCLVASYSLSELYSCATNVEKYKNNELLSEYNAKLLKLKISTCSDDLTKAEEEQMTLSESLNCVGSALGDVSTSFKKTYKEYNDKQKISSIATLSSNTVKSQGSSYTMEDKAICLKLYSQLNNADLEKMSKHCLGALDLTLNTNKDKTQILKNEVIPYENIDQDVGHFRVVKIAPGTTESDLIKLSKYLHQNFKPKEGYRYIDSLDGYQEYKEYENVLDLTKPSPKEFINKHLIAFSKYWPNGFDNYKEAGIYLSYYESNKDKTIKIQ
jgi:hypothetical protein